MSERFERQPNISRRELTRRDALKAALLIGGAFALKNVPTPESVEAKGPLKLGESLFVNPYFEIAENSEKPVGWRIKSVPAQYVKGLGFKGNRAAAVGFENVKGADYLASGWWGTEGIRPIDTNKNYMVRVRAKIGSKDPRFDIKVAAFLRFYDKDKNQIKQFPGLPGETEVTKHGEWVTKYPVTVGPYCASPLPADAKYVGLDFGAFATPKNENVDLQKLPKVRVLFGEVSLREILN